MSSATIAVVTTVMLIIGFTLWMLWSDRHLERNIVGALASGREWTAPELARLFDVNEVRVNHILRALEHRGIIWSRVVPPMDSDRPLRLYLMRRVM